MKIDKVHVGVSYTYQVEPFNVVKSEFQLEASLGKDDDIEEVREHLEETVTHQMLAVLDRLVTVHRAAQAEIIEPGKFAEGCLSPTFQMFRTEVKEGSDVLDDSWDD